MAEYFVDPETGNDSNNGTSVSTPWKKIPGQTGANSVVAGDIINVKNGTISSFGRLIFPANNLTYRGYGLAAPLYLTLPTENALSKHQYKAVREENVHEGFWTLYEPTQTSSIVAFSTRTGCSIEDVCIIAPNTTTAISIGTSGSNITGCSVKRSKITQCATGIDAFGLNLTLEDIYIENTANDAILINASLANSYRASAKDVLNRVCIINPGYDETTAIGDAIQTVASSDRFESSLKITNLYINKPSKVKQSLVFTDVLGDLLLETFYIESIPEGHAQILLSGVGGNFTIKNGFVKNGCFENAFFRYSGTQGIETGKIVSIKNIIVEAPLNYGFFTWGGSESASTIDGTVKIEHCHLNGTNLQNLSYSATVSFHEGSNITLGANAKGIVKNCIFSTQNKPSIRLPTGDANSAKWSIQNNAVSNPSFAIGSTNYNTVALFQAAHSYATNNITVTNTNLVNNLSLKHLGVFIDYNTDIENSSFNNPPSIGPFEYKYTRGVR